ncbi:MAG: hypothetical protein ACRCWD_02825 [Culicoidibacterales bacterium]
MAKTIYAKMTNDTDGVVLELCDYGYHVMGATVEEVVEQAQAYVHTHELKTHATMPIADQNAKQQVVILSV